MRPPGGKGIKRQKKGEAIDRRRLMHALISAAILHLLLFTVVELFIDLPGVSSSYNRKPAGTQVRIQFPSPQSSKQDSSRSSEQLSHQDPEESLHTTEEKPTDPTPKVAKIEDATEAAEAGRNTASGAEETAMDSTPDVKETGQTETFTQSTFPRTSQHLSSSSLLPVSSFPPSSSRRAGDKAEKMKVEKQDFTTYLKELLDKYHRYPLAARRRDIEGQAEFSVYVSKEGSLESLEILRSSGSRILDKAAEDLLEKVFPVDYPLTGTVSTTVRISYKLQDV